MVLAKFKLLTHEEENDFHAACNYDYKQKFPKGCCFISYDGDTDEAQLCIPLTTTKGPLARIRAQAVLDILNGVLEP